MSSRELGDNPQFPGTRARPSSSAHPTAPGIDRYWFSVGGADESPRRAMGTKSRDGVDYDLARSEIFCSES